MGGWRQKERNTHLFHSLPSWLSIIWSMLPSSLRWTAVMAILPYMSNKPRLLKGDLHPWPLLLPPTFLSSSWILLGIFVSNLQDFWKTLNSHALRHCGCLVSMQGLTLMWEWGVTRSLYLSLRRCFILDLLDYNVPLLLRMGCLSVDTSHPISMVLWIFLKFVARQMKGNLQLFRTLPCTWKWLINPFRCWWAQENEPTN